MGEGEGEEDGQEEGKVEVEEPTLAAFLKIMPR